jgi:hypothetical protein
VSSDPHAAKPAKSPTRPRTHLTLEMYRASYSVTTGAAVV